MELETALNRLGEQADRLVQEEQPLARSAGGLGRWSLTGAVSLVLYNALLVLGSPVILAILLAKTRCRPGLAQRLGKLPAELAADPDAETLWVHAVSMGEVIAVAPLVEGLRTRYPRARILISTVTETGREMAVQRLAGQARHMYLPLDFPWVVRRVLGGIRPRILILVETELWPNLLRQAAARGALTVLVNGRLSTESFQGYRWVRPLIRPLLRSLSLCAMQSDRDVERIICLGAAPERVVRAGNLKFDQVLGAAASGHAAVDLRLGPGEELFVAGSTHPVEEEIVLTCYRRLLEQAPHLVLVLAPRHIERAESLASKVRAQGLPAIGKTSLDSMTVQRGPRVIILDTRGELPTLYRDATVVFVGGSLVPIGGHNPLEPAAWGKAVLFGPHMDHFAEVAEQLMAQGGGLQVRNAEEMAETLLGLLRDRSRLQAMGQAARQLVLANQGAVSKTLQLIAGLLESSAVPAHR